jgi:hypothetical protein
MALGRQDEARPVLERSRDIFQQLRAAPSLALIEALLPVPAPDTRAGT